MKRNALFVVFVVLCTNIGLIQAQLPRVCLDSSTCLLGRYMKGLQTHLFEAFLGIPYAKPPIGDLRFKSPEEISLEGTIFATIPRQDCIQKDYVSAIGVITGSEDCLYLNVYRPLHSDGRKLPVLFYIHGGGFFSGSASPLVEGPEYFMDTEEVILVVPAYRLGPFGFLSTGDDAMPGNFGLKDQLLALKWVKTNIMSFGGDSDRVTIFGHSAGAAAAHYHLLSDASQDFFQNAILMSGVAFSPFAQINENPIQMTHELAKAVRIRDPELMTSRNLVKALQKINPIVLLRAVDLIKEWNRYPLTTFHPTLDGAFLTENPSLLSIKKPWIIGHVPSKGEGLVLANILATNPLLRFEFNQKFTEHLLAMLSLSSAITDDALKNITKEYMGPEYLYDVTMDGFFELLGDGMFIYPIYKTIQTHLTSSGEQNLKGIIKFDYRGPYSFSSTYTGSYKNFGTVHGDDSLYLFSGPKTLSLDYFKTSPEANLVKRYVDLYVEFAKTGNVERLKDIQACDAVSFEQGSCKRLSIVKSPALFQTDDGFDIDRFKLWEDLYA